MTKLSIFLSIVAVSGFASHYKTSRPACCHPFAALTERQMQFWEDVDEGLELFAREGKNIDRIRQWGRSARGESAPPIGYAPGHEPSEEHVEGLTAQPFWNISEMPDLFPWADELEANAGVIQEEFDSKLRNPNLFASDSIWQNQVMGTGWSAIRLQRLGVWNTDTCSQFPKTYDLLRSINIPLAVRGVCFARQKPGSGVQPHSDGRNFILTSQLGLKVPDDCWIQVGEEKRGWEEGKLTTIDTSFTHSTGNPSDSERHILIIDFWHPELTEDECSALNFCYDLRNQFETGQVPFRKPRSPQQGGLATWWQSVISKDS